MKHLRTLRIWLFVAAVVVAVPALLLARRGATGSELPRYGAVPDAALPAHDGTTLDLASLRGSVWIADFIFTRCLEVCPLMTTRMKALARDLDASAAGRQVRLVSFSVDPEHDTPAVLSDYAAKWNAAAPRWVFLSGSPAEVERVVTAGFKLAIQRKPQDKGVIDIVHANRFVLVDKGGEIRGYYDSEDAEAMAQLGRDAVRLLAE